MKTLLRAAEMKAAWARIEAWLRKHAPDELGELAPPASNRHINHLEDTVGVSVPVEMEQSYRIHDGSGRLWMFPRGLLMSVRGVEEEWLRWKELVESGVFEGSGSEPQGPIKPLHWNLRWLPVVENGGGDHICVDLDPAAGGSVGQIIEFNHEVGPVRVLAGGFSEWLEEFASRLESGRYAYEPDRGIVDIEET